MIYFFIYLGIDSESPSTFSFTIQSEVLSSTLFYSQSSSNKNGKLPCIKSSDNHTQTHATTTTPITNQYKSSYIVPSIIQ